MAQGVFVTFRIAICFGAWESKPYGTCIPISYRLKFDHRPLEVSKSLLYLIFERFTTGRLSYFPANVNPAKGGTPGKSGGLPRGKRE